MRYDGNVDTQFNLSEYKNIEFMFCNNKGTQSFHDSKDYETHLNNMKAAMPLILVSFNYSVLNGIL